MDNRIYQALIVLSDYNGTLRQAFAAWDRVKRDEVCDEQSLHLAESLIVAILIDHCDQLIPDDEEGQEALAQESRDRGFGEVRDIYLPGPDLGHIRLYEAVIAYAAALSQSHYLWKPWESVRHILMDAA